MSQFKTTVHDEIPCSYQRDEEGHLIEDAPCIRCEYNLRGLTVDMTCPECGLPVGRSGVGEYLRYRDPKWLNKITDGFLCLAVLLLAVDVFVMMALLNVFMANNFTLILVACSIAIAVTMYFYGAILSTAREPDNIKDKGVRSARMISRILLLLFPLVSPLLLMIAASIEIPYRWSSVSFYYLVIHYIYHFVPVLPLTIGLSLIVFMASKLSKRIPMMPLRYLLLVLAWIVVLSVFILPLLRLYFDLYAYFNYSNPHSSYKNWFDMFGRVLLISIPIYLLLTFVSLNILAIWFFFAVRQQTKIARLTWAARTDTTDG